MIQYIKYLSMTVWEDTFQMKISPLILADAMKFPQGDQETIDTNWKQQSIKNLLYQNSAINFLFLCLKIRRFLLDLLGTVQIPHCGHLCQG